MKPIVIDARSSLIGGLLAALMFLAIGARQGPTHVQDIPTCTPGPIRIAGIPDPRRMLVIRQENGLYTVPPGKLFVLTGLGASDYGWFGSSTLSIDGVQELSNISATAQSYDGGIDVEPVSVGEAPPGFTVPAGSTISVVGYQYPGRAWGYLVDV